MSNKAKDKKAAVMGSKKSKAPLIITLVVAFAAAGAGMLLLGGGSAEQGPVAATAVAATQSSVKEFAYPVSSFADGKAKYYSFKSPQGLDIRYFIMRSSDGVIRAAFDACDTCWQAAKGYRQDGDNMVCNNCGLRFPSIRINEVKGGCNPSPLTRTIAGNNVIIKVDDIIEQGSFYFNFNNRS